MNSTIRTLVVLGSISVIALSGCGKRAEIVGKIKDGFDQPLLAANISIRGTEFKTTSDASGSFRMPYVPGKFVVDVAKQSYLSVSLPLEVSAEATYPISETVLHKIPEQPGIFEFGRTDYIPVGIGQLKMNEAAMKLSHYVTGEFRKLASDATSAKFLLNQAWGPNGNGSLVQVASGGVVAVEERDFIGLRHVTSPPPIVRGDYKTLKQGIHVATFSLKEGRFAFARIPEIDYRATNPLASPVYLFRVGTPNARETLNPQDVQAAIDKLIVATHLAQMDIEKHFNQTKSLKGLKKLGIDLRPPANTPFTDVVWSISDDGLMSAESKKYGVVLSIIPVPEDGGILWTCKVSPTDLSPPACRQQDKR